MQQDAKPQTTNKPTEPSPEVKQEICGCGHFRGHHFNGRGICNAPYSGIYSQNTCICSRFKKAMPRPSPEVAPMQAWTDGERRAAAEGIVRGVRLAAWSTKRNFGEEDAPGVVKYLEELANEQDRIRNMFSDLAVPAVAPRETQMEPKIKPCPFCGAAALEPYLNKPRAGKTQRPRWELGCSQYCVTIYRGSKKDVVASWNQRLENGGS